MNKFWKTANLIISKDKDNKVIFRDNKWIRNNSSTNQLIIINLLKWISRSPYKAKPREFLNNNHSCKDKVSIILNNNKNNNMPLPKLCEKSKLVQEL